MQNGLVKKMNTKIENLKDGSILKMQMETFGHNANNGLKVATSELFGM